MGCGDVGMRVAARLKQGTQVLALTSQAARVPLLRAHGVLGLVAQLDEPDTLWRFAGVATHVVHLAPPPSQGLFDPRTRVLVQALMRRSEPQSVVYGSTSGVYGDCQGEWVDETRVLHPESDRACRRVDAQHQEERPAVAVNDGAGWAPVGAHAALNSVPEGKMVASSDAYWQHQARLHEFDLLRRYQAAQQTLEQSQPGTTEAEQ